MVFSPHFFTPSRPVKFINVSFPWLKSRWPCWTKMITTWRLRRGWISWFLNNKKNIYLSIWNHCVKKMATARGLGRGWISWFINMKHLSIYLQPVCKQRLPLPGVWGGVKSNRICVCLSVCVPKDFVGRWTDMVNHVTVQDWQVENGSYCNTYFWQ